MSPPRILIIGAGSRGEAYSRAIQSATSGIISCIAEPFTSKRERFGKKFIWKAGAPSEGQSFVGWKEFIQWETTRRAREAAGEHDVPPGVDAAFVCVLDEMHREVVVGLGPLGLHIMCEKPLATRMRDCVDMYRAVRGGVSEEPKSLFSIGHVLRYSPHNILLRKLILEDRAIGDVLSVEHTEPVGWWHFAHSYVRGNWRDSRTSAPTLLTKSCHDIDFLLWLLCSPAKPSGEAHLPQTVSSAGSLQFFRKPRKPAAAKDATNCLSCPLADEGCNYSAKHIYVGPKFRGLESQPGGQTGWPTKIVLPDVEDYPNLDAKREALLAQLSEDYDSETPAAEVSARGWYGRCVFESDNNVADDEVVTITWDDDASSPGKLAKRAVFHMTAHTQRICDRYSKIYGTDGEIAADSRTISVTRFDTQSVQTFTPTIEDTGHGGGDIGLTRQFVTAVDKVKNEGWAVDTAQKEIIGCTLDEVLRSHAMVFAAEEARSRGATVEWSQWWDKEVNAALG